MYMSITVEKIHTQIHVHIYMYSVWMDVFSHRVAHLSTHKLHVELVHRPASGNVGVQASVDRLEMIGRSSAEGKEDAPVIITTKKEEAGAFLCVSVCVCVCVCVCVWL